MKTKDQMVEFYNQLYSTTVRRYPEYDVAAFSARLSAPLISMDLGTGTGRNLLPLMQASADGGLIVATDMSETGVEQVARWAAAVGGIPCKLNELPGSVRARIEASFPNPDSFTIHQITRLDNASWLGPNAIFKGEDHSVYLLTGVANMAEKLAEEGTVDAIINRGSIFYLAHEDIESCMESMRRALKSGGQLLLTLKSTCDSKFADGVSVGADGYRRRVQDDQISYEIEFYDERRIRECVCGFEIVSVSHLVTQYMSKGLVIADWSIVLKRN